MSTKVGDKVTNTVYSNSNKRLIHEEEVFDIIFSHHEQFGHRKARGKHNALKNKYHNISEECLILFVDNCTICNEEILPIYIYQIIIWGNTNWSVK